MSLADVMSAAGLVSWAEAGLVLSFVTFLAVTIKVVVARSSPAMDRVRNLPLDDGVLDRLQRQLGRSLFGVEMPGQTLNYVWSSRVPIGQSWTSPHHPDARLVAVATSRPAAGQAEHGEVGEVGEVGEWSEIVVDWAADAKREFGDAPRAAPYALAIMVDADAVCGRAAAWFSDFRLLGPESAVKRP